MIVLTPNPYTGETLGEFHGYKVNLDTFDALWRTLAKLGLQDSLGGCEYRRAIEDTFGISYDLDISWTPAGKASGAWPDAVRKLRSQQRAERKADRAKS